jgi:transcriptional regulator with XRE-family HTH domain
VNELGEILRSARQKKNLSLSQVARATRIKQSYLEALEDGEYSVLPGPAYVTGFLRNYALYLGLHPDDLIQEYYAVQAPPQPRVKAATRVLASGHERQNRSKVLWALAAVILLLAGGYAIREYNNAIAHSYSAPLKLTPQNLGAPDPTPAPHRVRSAARIVQLRLQATAPVWVRVTADNHRVFQGLLRPGDARTRWLAHHTIYVVTYDGAHLRATYNGRRLGLLAHRPGLTVDLATPRAWQRVS